MQTILNLIPHIQLWLGSVPSSLPTLDLPNVTAPMAAAASPWLAPAAGLVGGVASGLIGLLGGNNANTANSNAEDQAEAYNTEMSDTVYQRTTADMKAAGINPMFLAMGAGTNGAPTSPMYQATNTLRDFASSAADIGDLYEKYQNAKGQAADANTKEAASNVAEPMQEASLQEAQANASKANTAAGTAAATQLDTIKSADAKAAQDAYDAKMSGIDAENYKFHYWNNEIGTAANSAEKVIEGLGVGKFLKNFGGPYKSYNPNTTGTFDKGTGEIHE